MPTSRNGVDSELVVKHVVSSSSMASAAAPVAMELANAVSLPYAKFAATQEASGRRWMAEEQRLLLGLLQSHGRCF